MDVLAYVVGGVAAVGVAFGANRARIRQLTRRVDQLVDVDARIGALAATLDAVLDRVKRIEKMVDRER